MVKRRNQIIVCICFMLTCSFSFIRGNQTMFLGNYFNIIPFEFSLVSPLEFSPVPKAKDFYWKKIIPSTIREDYIKLGKQYQNQKWQPIPDALFADYKKTGNRKNYETPYFEKRRQLSCLVMAEIMDYQGIFLKDIDNGLKYFVSEPWWGIPAHYPTDYPDEKNQKVDLFNPETANLLAWTIYMLHDELETIDKGICDLIVNEIQRRVLIPARTVGYYWNRSLDNWNTWICSNLISCILFCESSRNQQIDDIKRVIDCLEYFIINYHGDGGCEEGIMYWDRAGASLYECVYLLDLATSHAISLRNDRKLKAIGKYAYKMYIGNKTYVNFADSHPFSGVHINILYPFGQYVNDSVMMKQAAFIAKENGYDKSPATAFRGSGNFPTLSRELMFLYQYESFSKTSAEEPLLRDTEFNELHVITARSNENSTKGLYIAAKGGNNNEYHNHNDVGNFVVYKDAEPIIIDIGVGTYTGQTFGEKRYENFNCRSGYHNVPLINGVEQRDGKEYYGQKYKYKNKKKQVTYTLDLSHAYPQDAYVEEWKRTINLQRNKEISFTEKYRLSKYTQPSVVSLICCGEAKITGKDIILIYNGKNTGELHFDSKSVTPTIERIIYEDNIISSVWGGRDLFRIKLTIKSNNLKGVINYSIQ